MPHDPDREPLPVGRTRFSLLFKNSLTRIVHYARGQRAASPVRHQVETLDAVQDASADFLKKPRRVKSDTHFLNLIKGFVRNAFRVRRRREQADKRGGMLREDTRSPSQVTVSGSWTGPVRAAMRKEKRERIKVGLARLAPPDRKVIKLRAWEDRAWADIARHLNLPSEDAARMSYARALDRLRKAMPGEIE